MIVGTVGLLDFSPVELLIILAILLLIFGAKRLPELARSIGTSARELRKGMSEGPAAESTHAGDQNDKSA